MNFLEKFGRSAMELKTLRCITVTGILIALDIVLKMLSIKITNDLKITFAFLALATIGMLFGPTVGFLAGIITDIVGYMFSGEGGFNPLFTVIEAIGAMIYGIFLYEIKPVAFLTDKKHLNKDSIVIVVLRSILYSIICSELFGLIFCSVSLLLMPHMYNNQGKFSDIGKIGKVLLNEPLGYCALVIGFLYSLIFMFVISFWGQNENKKKSISGSLRVILSKITVVIICNLIMTPVALVYSGVMTWDSLASSYILRFIKNAIQCPVDCLILLIVLFPILAAYKKIFPKTAAAHKKSTESDVTND